MYKNAQFWICKYCNQGFYGRRNYFNHLKECDEKLKLPHDKIGRVIVLGRAKKSAETFKKKVLNGEAKYKSIKHTEKTKQHLSEKRSEWLLNHQNHGVKWFTVNNIKVQGTWEKKFAEHLNKIGVIWERKKIKFCKTHSYTPDFYCPEQNVYFEVKGFRRDRDIYKIYLALFEHPDLQIKMIEKNEINNLDNIDIFNLPNFNQIYKFEDIDITLFNNVWN